MKLEKEPELFSAELRAAFRSLPARLLAVLIVDAADEQLVIPDPQ